LLSQCESFDEGGAEGTKKKKELEWKRL
jgi:hypothetical protein